MRLQAALGCVTRLVGSPLGPGSYLLLAILTVQAVAVQPDDEVFSGPQPDEQLPPLKMRIAYGPQSGEVIDVVEHAGDKALLLVVVNGANRPAAQLTRALMNLAEMHADQLSAATVYLDADATAAHAYLQRAIAWWGAGPPVGVATDGAEGPGAWGLNRNVNLTIIVARSKRVVANFALVQPSLTDGDRIIPHLSPSIGPPLPNRAVWTFLSLPTRHLPEVAWSPAPADVRLRRLLCTVLSSPDDTQLSNAVDAVEAYAAGNKRRQQALGRAAAAMLQRNTRAQFLRLPVAPQLETWRRIYAAK